MLKEIAVMHFSSNPILYKNMKTLLSYILESYVCEGGASGHMMYPHNYIDFTFEDLKQIVTDLLSGNITDITEKIDGMNIQATKNNSGEVVFIRNKSDLNSERGGMLKSDMISKWHDKPHVLDTFSSAATTIEKVFAELPISFFNDNDERRYVNCECVIAGKTNIMPYVSNQVDFHDIWVYKFNGKEWIKDSVTKDGLDKIEKACKNTDARLTPQVIINTTKDADKLCDKYLKQLDEIGDDKQTIKDWMWGRYDDYIRDRLEWINTSETGKQALFNRYFLDDKIVNLRLLRKEYANNLEDLEVLEKKDHKDMLAFCMEPLDDFFLFFGNDIIKLCKGLINQGREDEVVKELISDMQDVVKDIKKNGSIEMQEKLSKQLTRIEKIGQENIHAAEGIVFRYKGKTMKLTSAFAPLNQICGAIKFSK